MSGSDLVLYELPRWWTSISRAFVFIFILTLSPPLARSDDPHLLPSQDTKVHMAHVNVTYVDKETRKEGSKKYDGKYGKNSNITPVSGIVLHALSEDNKSGTTSLNNFGCTSYVNPKFPSEQWIALVERGVCTFTEKMKTATVLHNASAIVIYSNVISEYQTVMDHEKVLSSVSVFLSQAEGKEIVHLLDRGYIVHMHITPGPEAYIGPVMPNSISKTSVLFVSISFIVLMIISLAWLVFYYIQRFRYSHAKERLARRLVCAAKKAIAKIPHRTLKVGDKELDGEFDQCAVCIEPYKAHDVVRILPCRHVFHKSCVDPWLLDQRSCPMCKLDILRAFGMQIGGSQESVHQDPESRPVAIISHEPEISSSVEDTQAEEIKVLLIPHTCLHFRACEDEEEASASLLACGGVDSAASNTSSQNSKGNRHFRSECISSEMKSLIGKGKGKKRKWKSKEECNGDEDDDDDVDVDESIIRGIESTKSVIETASKDQKVEKTVNTAEDSVNEGSLCSSATLSLQSLSSSDQLNKLGQSESGNTDKDPELVVTVVTNDPSLQGAKANVKFHTSDS